MRLGRLGLVPGWCSACLRTDARSCFGNESSSPGARHWASAGLPVQAQGRRLTPANMGRSAGRSVPPAPAHCFCLVLALEEFAEAVLLCGLGQISEANRRGSPGLLVLQDKPLESSLWLGTQKSLCRPDVLRPPQRTAGQKSLQGVDWAVTGPGEAVGAALWT